MTTDLVLSQMVETYIEDLDWEGRKDLSPDEKKERDKNERIVSLLIKNIVESRQSITDGQLRGIKALEEQVPEVVRDLLNEYYTRELVGSFAGCVKRTVQLSRIETSVTASRATNTYVRKSSRAFILGLPQACVALCRAALEQALKENIGYQSKKNYLKMDELLDEAQGAGVLDDAARRDARRIASIADDVLHEKPTDLDKAFEVLFLTQRLLERIYAA